MADAAPGPAPMQEGRRLHPLTLVQRFVVSLPALVLLLLPVLRRPDANAWFSLLSVAFYGVFIVPLIVLQYLRFRYEITPREIVIRRGVLNTQHRSIPIERIHNIEIEQKLLQRLLGIAKVQIETAGSTTAEGVLDSVSLEEAHHIREAVRTYQRQSPETSPSASPTVAPEAADLPDTPPGGQAEIEEKIFGMDVGRVLLSGVFRFSLLYIVLIFSAMEYTGLDPERAVDFLVQGRFAWMSAVVAESPLLIVAASLVVVALLAWMTGIAINLNRYYGFRLMREGDKLHRSHGLLTRSQGTIPVRKIQALVLRTNPAMRFFGWYALELQTMGADENDRGHEVAVPFARLDEILPIARSLRPFELPEHFERVSRLTIRRTFFRYGGALALAVAALYFVWEWALWGLVLLPFLLGFAVLHWRNHGYAFDETVLYVRRGVLRQYVWITPATRFQAFHLEGSLFQRRLGLRSLNVDTAGAGSFRYPVIVDLPETTAERLFTAVYERFRALHG